MTLSQVLQKRMEEFEKEFGSAVKEYDLEFGPWDGTSLGDDLKSFSLATSLAFIESFGEMVGEDDGKWKDHELDHIWHHGIKAYSAKLIDPYQLQTIIENQITSVLKRHASRLRKLLSE